MLGQTEVEDLHSNQEEAEVKCEFSETKETFQLTFGICPDNTYDYNFKIRQNVFH